MNQHNIHLVDLPNEILFFILKKLGNIDVLYSLLGINNQLLDTIAQEQIFTNTLNFVSKSLSTNEICSISDSMLDRFCTSILPRIHNNVKCLIVESISIKRILLAANYPNLTELKIFNFNKSMVSPHFPDNCLFRYIRTQQITDLTLIINENKIEITQDECTIDDYTIIVVFFENLKHLTIVPSPINDSPFLPMHYLSPTTFCSSTLTKLCINVISFDNCLALLDGRLKQLTTFIVQVDHINHFTSMSYNMDDLLNLKCFSLICYNSIREYDILIVPLLRRMSHLEELTLYLRILGGLIFIDGTHLDNIILIHMPQLHTFTFYLTTQNVIADSTVRLSNEDIQRTFTNTKHRHVACMVDYFGCPKVICRVFSLPFKFNRLKDITNNFPNMVFDTVTCLMVHDEVEFKHEFFIRLARSFPFVKHLSVSNIRPPFLKRHERHLYNTDWCSIVEYTHLISLDVEDVTSHYIEHFLNETKTRLPRLTRLKICYDQLKIVTKNFTRDATRYNCAKVKRLIVQDSVVYSKDVYHYFPSLSI